MSDFSFGKTADGAPAPALQPINEGQKIALNNPSLRDRMHGNVDARAQTVVVETHDRSGDGDGTIDMSQDTGYGDDLAVADHQADDPSETHTAELMDSDEWREVLAALNHADKRLPEKLHDRVIELVDPDGRVWPTTVTELVAGNMMHRDYTQKTTEVARVRREAQTCIAGARKLVADMAAGGESFLGIVELLGVWPGFHSACEIYAIDQLKLENMLPGERKATELARHNANEARRLERANQQLQAALQQQTVNAPSSIEQYRIAMLEKYLPEVMQETGWMWSHEGERVFQGIWGPLADQHQGEITKDLVRTAMKAAQQELALLVTQSERILQQQNAGRLPPSPQVLSSNPALARQAQAPQYGSPMQAAPQRSNNGQFQRRKISDFNPGARR